MNSHVQYLHQAASLGTSSDGQTKPVPTSFGASLSHHAQRPPLLRAGGAPKCDVFWGLFLGTSP